MPRNILNFIVYDFETGGLEPGYHEAVEIGAKAYDSNWDEIPEAEFVSLMRPLYPERLDKRALAVNGRTVEELMAAPEQGVVWKKFAGWVDGFANKKAPFGGRPICCGKNIRKFDNKFLQELNILYLPKKGETKLFSDRFDIDLEDHLFAWHNHDDDLPKYAMDTVREYYGLSKEGAHGALVDVRQTGAMLARFYKFYRRMATKVKADGTPLVQFKGSFSGQAV